MDNTDLVEVLAEKRLVVCGSFNTDIDIAKLPV